MKHIFKDLPISISCLNTSLWGMILRGLLLLKLFKTPESRSLFCHCTFDNLAGAASSLCAEKDMNISENFRQKLCPERRCLIAAFPGIPCFLVTRESIGSKYWALMCPWHLEGFEEEWECFWPETWHSASPCMWRTRTVVFILWQLAGVCGVCLDELCASIRCCLGCGKGPEEFIISILLPVHSWYLT